MISKVKRLSIYWTPADEKLLQAAADHMAAQGLRITYNGKPNVSAVIRYALEQLTRQK